MTLLLSACTSPTGELDVGTLPGERVAFQVLEAGAQSGRTEDPLAFAVRDEASWQAFWRDHTREQPSPKRAPVIDWSRRLAVVVILGEQPTGGHSVTLDAVRYANGTYDVYHTHHRPGTGCAVSQAVTNPFVLASVARAGPPDAIVSFHGVLLTRPACR